MPTNLSKEEKTVWRWVVETLEQMRVLTLADRNAIQIYVETWVLRAKMKKFIEENGEVFPVKDRNGKPKDLKAFPQVRLLRQYTDQLLRMSQEFGLTPAARARLESLSDEIKPAVVANPMEDVEKKYFA